MTRHLISSMRLSTSMLFAATLMTVSPAFAIPRDQVMTRARAYAYHPWRCTTANLTASCSSTYKSKYLPGDYIGLPYDWGGYMTLFEFDQQISKGYGAGSHSGDGVLLCTSGLDCSGYVSKCWDAGHWSTSTLNKISSPISQASILPGDAFNKAGSHVILYSHSLASGEPIFYEAAGENVHITVNGGWSRVSGFQPVRYNKISGTSAGNPLGTTTNPIVINALPYTDARDTTNSSSDSIDGCGVLPTRDETGPEYVYKVKFAQPGTVTIQVSDDVGAEIDVGLYGTLNTSDCLESHESVINHAVDCGTYYIVVDTHADKVGHYTLKVAFSPASGQACGSGPPAYAPKGKLGDACANPNNENLPFCNPNLGATMCLYGTTSSFCTKSCTDHADCAVFSGGCCKDISGKGEYYCMTSGFCQGVKRDAGISTDLAMSDMGQGAHDGAVAHPDTMTRDATGASDGHAIERDSASLKGDMSLSGDENDEGGCSCRTTGGGGESVPASVVLLLLFVASRRRRVR